jgi:hypothetical protein
MAKTSKQAMAQEAKPQKVVRAWDIYTTEEKKAYKGYMRILSDMRDSYRRGLIEFDDKTYLQQYEENRKADLGYSEDVTEANDFRLTTGLTREKDTTVISTLVNFNLKPNITSFQKDNTIIGQLGAEMEDLVNKSRELEVYPEKRQDIYREFVSQGTVYVEEVYKEVRILSKSETTWLPKQKISEYTGDAFPIYDVEGRCETKLHLGKFVLVSSLNEAELNNNDCVATYEEVDRGKAESIYGGWDRWELVPEEVNNETPFNDTNNANIGSDFIWNTYKVAKGKVGITKVYQRFSNKAMIILNGVMVLPVGFPMTKLSPSGLYPIAKGIAERIPNFAFGKGIPSKTRVDQKMYDILLRAMLGKSWQSYKPALGNRSGNVLSRDIINAGQMTHGIKQNDIFTILPQQLLSISNGDVTMFEMVKQVINEKSVTDSYAAQTVPNGATATEVINQQKQTMLKLASLIDGIRALEKRLILLRIYNIVANWTIHEEVPLYEDVKKVVDGLETVVPQLSEKKGKRFSKYSIDTNFTDGKKGTKVIQFVGNDASLPTVRDQIKDEEKMAKEYGKPVRLSYINAEWLRVLEVIWNVDVIVTSEGDDQMKLLMYIDNLTRISELFGVQVFKQDYVLQRIASRMSEDFDKMFNVQDANAAMEGLMKQLQGGQIKNPAQQILNAGRPTPLSAAKVA